MDEQFQQSDGLILVEVGLQIIKGDKHSVKVFFSQDRSVPNLINGHHPGMEAIEVMPDKEHMFHIR